MNKRVVIVLVSGITLLAAVLRFSRLASVPPGLYWDEVSIGYSAYAILTTGKDEYGIRFPLLFRSLDDYKLPAYIYATAVSMMIFGKTDFAVRFPSALAGTLTVLLTYFLVTELFKENKPSTLNPRASTLAIVAALLLAISPWHIQVSRVGFETNLALFFVICGLLSFLHARKGGFLLSVSVFFFVLSAATYHSARLFAPIFLLTLLLVERETMRKKRRQLILAGITGIILTAPLLPQIFSRESLLRPRVESIIGQKKPFELFLNNYMANFDTTFLFFRGDQNGRHSVRKLGMLYVFELPLILIGMRSLLKGKGKGKLILIAWLLLAPIPSALSKINPHALRSVSIVPVWHIISALGFVRLLQWMGNKGNMRLIIAGSSLFLLGMAYNVWLYLHQYYAHYPRETALDWQDGMKEAVEILAHREDQYEEIFVSDALPPIYVAFYLPIDPEKYQQLKRPITAIEKIRYFKYAWEIEKNQDKPALMIAPFWQKPDEKTGYQEVKMINGDTVFNIWED